MDSLTSADWQKLKMKLDACLHEIKEPLRARAAEAADGHVGHSIHHRLRNELALSQGPLPRPVELVALEACRPLRGRTKVTGSTYGFYFAGVTPTTKELNAVVQSVDVTKFVTDWRQKVISSFAAVLGLDENLSLADKLRELEKVDSLFICTLDTCSSKVFSPFDYDRHICFEDAAYASSGHYVAHRPPYDVAATAKRVFGKYVKRSSLQKGYVYLHGPVPPEGRSSPELLGLGLGRMSWVGFVRSANAGLR